MNFLKHQRSATSSVMAPLSSDGIRLFGGRVSTASKLRTTGLTNGPIQHLITDADLDHGDCQTAASVIAPQRSIRSQPDPSSSFRPV